jgi:hypothetical protein
VLAWLLEQDLFFFDRKKEGRGYWNVYEGRNWGTLALDFKRSRLCLQMPK